ncbi:MAG: hypothetical protein ACRCTY_09540, partial [Candidatus Adiutrix sp.]
RRFKRLGREIPLHRLALVVPDLSVYSPMIDDVGRRFAVPFYLRRGESLAKKGPVLAVFEFLTLGASNFEAQRVLRFMASPYFKFAKNPQVLCRNLVFKGGVTDDRAGGGFEENLNKKANEPWAKNILLGVNQLRKAYADLNCAETWADFFTIFQIILDDLGWCDDLSSLALNHPSVYEDERLVFHAFKHHLGRLQEALMGPHAPLVTVKNFKFYLKQILADEKPVYDENPSGRVQVLNYHDLEGGVFDEIFCLGLNEGVFPRTGPNKQWWPCGFMPSVSSTFMGRALWKSPADRYRQDEAMLAMAFGQAKNKIWLFYSESDDSGKPCLPSPILQQVRDLWMH